MELHIETSGLLGDRLFINDKHGCTVAEVHLLVRDAAPFIVKIVNAHKGLLEALKHMVAVSNWATTIQSEEQYDAMIAEAEAAIRKAQGE